MESLPFELLACIQSFLSNVSDCLSMTQVCKRWHKSTKRTLQNYQAIRTESTNEKLQDAVAMFQFTKWSNIKNNCKSFALVGPNDKGQRDKLLCDIISNHLPRKSQVIYCSREPCDPNSFISQAQCFSEIIYDTHCLDAHKIALDTIRKRISDKHDAYVNRRKPKSTEPLFVVVNTSGRRLVADWVNQVLSRGPSVRVFLIIVESCTKNISSTVSRKLQMWLAEGSVDDWDFVREYQKIEVSKAFQIIATNQIWCVVKTHFNSCVETLWYKRYDSEQEMYKMASAIK